LVQPFSRNVANKETKKQAKKLIENKQYPGVIKLLYFVMLHQILAPAPVNMESAHLSLNPTKFVSGQISSQIWRMPVQLPHHNTIS